MERDKEGWWLTLPNNVVVNLRRLEGPLLPQEGVKSSKTREISMVETRRNNHGEFDIQQNTKNKQEEVKRNRKWIKIRDGSKNTPASIGNQRKSAWEFSI